MRSFDRNVVAALLLALACAGCGYQAGISVAPEYTSIGIEIFGRDGRDAPVRNLERDLHAELVRSTRTLVDAEVLSPSRAQLVMRGTIETYRRRPGVRNRDNQQVETGIEVIVRAELRDRSTGDLASGPITASTNVGYNLGGQDVEQDTLERLLPNLSDRIVLELMTELVSREDPAPASGPGGESGEAAPRAPPGASPGA